MDDASHISFLIFMRMNLRPCQMNQFHPLIASQQIYRQLLVIILVKSKEHPPKFLIL